MKKLIIVALLLGATSAFADNYKPAPPCECTGVGIPTPKNPRIPSNITVSTSKEKPLTVGQLIFYRAQLTWWMYLTRF